MPMSLRVQNGPPGECALLRSRRTRPPGYFLRPPSTAMTPACFLSPLFSALNHSGPELYSRFSLKRRFWHALAFYPWYRKRIPDGGPPDRSAPPTYSDNSGKGSRVLWRTNQAGNASIGGGDYHWHLPGY